MKNTPANAKYMRNENINSYLLDPLCDYGTLYYQTNDVETSPD